MKEMYLGFLIQLPLKKTCEIYKKLLKNGIEVRKVNHGIVINVNETTTSHHIKKIMEVFNEKMKIKKNLL